MNLRMKYFYQPTTRHNKHYRTTNRTLFLGSILGYWLLVGLLSNPAISQGQDFVVYRTDSTVRTDGVLSESIWKRAMVATHFIQNFPTDTLPALNQTEVRLTYDAHFLYVGIICYDTDPKRPWVASSLRRDFDWGTNDNFTVYLDPFGDRINGFTFNITPYGVEREGQMWNGEQVNEAWDSRWRSSVKRYADRWVGEMAIPFKTLRYPKGAQKFLMNFARHDLKNNQRTAWSRVPIAYWISSLAFAREVHFEHPLPHPGLNVVFIPYLTGAVADELRPNKAPNWSGNVGFDAKVAVTPSLNLDLTVNPDFSQTDVDQIVTNLDRFEIFYPERRQFFLENNDLFNNLGFEVNRPFFSRRIGLGAQHIQFGARLSGKLDENWRIGLMNMQTARQAENPAQNYTVGIVQRQIFGRSSITGLVVNRSAVGANSVADKYTRVVGGEYNLQTDDNRWSGKAYYYHQLTPQRQTDSYSHGATLSYNTQNFSLTWLHDYVGSNYRINDVGYVPRRAYWRMSPEASYTFYSKVGSRVVSHGPSVETNIIHNLSGKLTDREIEFNYQFTMLNTSEFGIGAYHYYTYLFFPFDPTNTGGVQLPQSSAYVQRGAQFWYNSDARKRLNFSVEGWGGEYFNGHIVSITPVVNYRFQPYGSLGITTEYNSLRLPQPYNSADLWLIGPRLDISFSRSVFLNSFVQFNRQTNTTSANVRLQWRFKPVSDLFIVYSYFDGQRSDYSPDVPVTTPYRFGLLRAKLSYWFNL